MKSGKRNFLEPSGPLQACNGTDLPFIHVFISFCFISRVFRYSNHHCGLQTGTQSDINNYNNETDIIIIIIIIIMSFWCVCGGISEVPVYVSVCTCSMSQCVLHY